MVKYEYQNKGMDLKMAKNNTNNASVGNFNSYLLIFSFSLFDTKTPRNFPSLSDG